MSRLRPALIPFVLCWAIGVRAAAPSEGEAIPTVGRPVDLPFSEASGWFEVQARAEPTSLSVESPLTFTLVVRAVQPARQEPQRLDLRQLPEFAEAFYIDDVGEQAARPDARTWEFSYRLKPRRLEVRAIPSVPFVYFNPYLLTTNKGFQVLYTDPIPLTVTSRETVQVPVRGSEGAFVLSTDSEVWEHRTPWTPPGGTTLAALVLLPPLGCIVWYLTWRRLYPDAARLASQRRSRAARKAIGALQGGRRLPPGPRAARMAGIVAGYLQQRLDWTVAEPTPREVAQLLEQRGCSASVVAQAVRFFEWCDSARFVPEEESSLAGAESKDVAVRLILAVESESDAASK